MMQDRQPYYFSVEGETEYRYLIWLERLLNTAPEATQQVRFYVRVEKDPFARAKGMAHFDDLRITHICDVESEDAAHVQHFRKVLARMHAAEAAFEHVTYELGYCNYTFELWILLHRMDTSEPLKSRQEYLPLINQAFGEKFQGFGQYKREKGFSRVLRQITLEDVVAAVGRAEQIECNNERKYEPIVSSGYSYFAQNPSLSLGTVIGEILDDCGIIR